MKIHWEFRRLYICGILFIVFIILLLVFLFKFRNEYLFTTAFGVLGLSFAAFSASQDNDPNYFEETLLKVVLDYIRFTITSVFASVIVTKILKVIGIDNKEFYLFAALSITYLMFHIDFLKNQALLLLKK